MKQFVSRKRELNLFDDLYHRPGGQFLVLYGRRRVGKTRLLAHWLSTLDGPDGEGGRHLYWMATQTSAANQLRNFSQALFNFLNPRAAGPDPAFSYASWETALAEVRRAAENERLVLVLDEFTYVMQADPEIPSLFQKVWDHQLKESSLFLILSGSLAGIIERTILAYQAPLYGRATASIRLLPLPFGALAEMLPRYKPEDRVAVQAVTGGIPAYVELFDDRISVQENLAQRIVTPANAMLSDAAFLLHEQLGEPRNYMAIIESIAAGYHGLSDIARMAGISRTNIVKYLSVLADLGYVERQVPATVRRPEKSRQGRYVIVDAYLRFYYRFLAPNLGFIERGMTRQATTLLENQLVHFIGTYTFEELCRQWVAEQADMGALPFLPERIGSFWSRKAQVDVVATNWRTRDLLLGECKWGAGKVGPAVIRAHFDKTPYVIPDERQWQIHHIFFAREGFTPAAEEAAATQGAQLITLDQLEVDMQQWAAQLM